MTHANMWCMSPLQGQLKLCVTQTVIKAYTGMFCQDIVIKGGLRGEEASRRRVCA